MPFADCCHLESKYDVNTKKAIDYTYPRMDGQGNGEGTAYVDQGCCEENHEHWCS